MKDIINRNSKDQLHGYHQLYRGKLLYRANWKNDKCIGYEESHGIKKTYFYIR